MKEETRGEKESERQRADAGNREHAKKNGERNAGER